MSDVKNVLQGMEQWSRFPEIEKKGKSFPLLHLSYYYYIIGQREIPLLEKNISAHFLTERQSPKIVLVLHKMMMFEWLMLLLKRAKGKGACNFLDAQLVLGKIDGKLECPQPFGWNLIDDY